MSKRNSNKVKKCSPGKKSNKSCIRDPLSKYKLVCDKGLVTEKEQPNSKTLHKLNLELGELYDVYCVSKGGKPLAALDYSSYGKTKLRKHNLLVKNEVIEYCNSVGINSLHNTKKGGMYLKTVFFLPGNFENALKLMKILWYSDTFESNIDANISIGILLGYDYDNIISFIKKNYEIVINLKKIREVEKKIKEMKVTLDELQKDYKIVHQTNIKKL